MTIRIDGTNTAANPGITGTDTDTGLQFGTDEVNVVTGGTTRATVDSSGRLLIGTSSAPTTPNGSLQFAVESPTTFTTSVFASNANSVNGAYIALQHGRGGTADSDTIVQSGDDLGGIQFVGADGTTTRREAATIKGQVDGTPGAGDMPGRLVFSTTADGAASPTEAMRIDSSQNLLFNSGYGSVATAYGVRAWVNLNGTGTVSIREDGNVSSITDNGTGLYQVNFATAMPDANYAAVSEVRVDVTGENTRISGSATYSTTQFQIEITNAGNTAYRDSDMVNIIVVR
jgi:hypothetical protein